MREKKVKKYIASILAAVLLTTSTFGFGTIVSEAATEYDENLEVELIETPEDNEEVYEDETEITEETEDSLEVSDEKVQQEDEEVVLLEDERDKDDNDSSIRILMIGNSLTRYNDVATKLTKLFDIEGVSAHIDTRTQMGASLFDQADILKESSRDAVVNGNYDYIILQEKSSGFSKELLSQGVEAFYPWIEEAPNQPELLLYMPWANEDKLWEGQTEMTNAYVAVAKEYNAKLAPAGEAYYEMYFDNNKKWYRKGDNVHGNDLASLISASTIYYSITEKESAISFTGEDSAVMTSLVESDDYRNNRVAYDCETLNLIQKTALKYVGLYKDLDSVPNIDERGLGDRPESPATEDESGEVQPGAEGNEEESESEEPEKITVKVFPGDYLQVRVGESLTDMSLFYGTMYECSAKLFSGENNIEIIANGKVVAERNVSISGSSEEVIIRYFADKDKIVTGKDVHEDVNGNPVQDIKKRANWTGNFFKRTGVEEFKEFGGWDQNNALSRLEYLGGGVFKRSFTYTVPENDVTYQFKLNFDGVWSNGELPSENAKVVIPASEKEKDVFVLFVNSITGEWFDSINTEPVSFILEDGNKYEVKAGEAVLSFKIGDNEAENMIQTSLKSYCASDYVQTGNYKVSVFIDGNLLDEKTVSIKDGSLLTVIYDAEKGIELVSKVAKTENGSKVNKPSTSSGNTQGTISAVQSSTTSSNDITDNEETLIDEVAVDNQKGATTTAALSVASPNMVIQMEEVTDSVEDASEENMQEEVIESESNQSMEEEEIEEPATPLAVESEEIQNDIPMTFILAILAAGIIAAGGAGVVYLRKIK